MSQTNMSNNKRWSARNFGSRRGLLETVRHQLYYLTGRYRAYKKIDWSTVNRLVFVCKGNICRSAYAEEFARIKGIDSISFGLETVDNANANEKAIQIAQRQGINLTPHKTTTVASVELKQTDLLIAMEPWQLKALEDIFSKKYQCTLLGLWTKPVLPHIQDPYGMPDSYFDICFTRIRSGITTLAGNIST